MICRRMMNNWWPVSDPQELLLRQFRKLETPEQPVKTQLSAPGTIEIHLKQAELAATYGELAMQDASIQRMKLELKNELNLGHRSAAAAISGVERFNDKLEEKGVNLNQNATAKVSELEAQQQFSSQFLAGAQFQGGQQLEVMPCSSRPMPKGK